MVVWSPPKTMRKALFFLGILNDSDIDWLVKHGSRREVAEGAKLVEQGKQIDSVFLVIDGRFSVTVSGGAREVAQLMSGEVIGEISFVDSNLPSASVTALERSFALAIPRTRLNAKLEADAQFAARFYRALAVFLADRLRNTLAALGSKQTLDQDKQSHDELDADTLDNLSLAGARFEWIQNRLRSG